MAVIEGQETAINGDINLSFLIASALSLELSQGQVRELLPLNLDGLIASQFGVVTGSIIFCLLNDFNYIQGDYLINAQGLLNGLLNKTGDFHNYLSALGRFFGVNAAQTATQLFIKKSDLPLLTHSTDNTAESLLIALLIHVIQNESNSLMSNVFVDQPVAQIIANYRITTIDVKIYPEIISTDLEEVLINQAITPRLF
ncbi:hypothetical protein [Gloeocapsopsis dulcis]|uniref:Uncharacterized protein n=1 Tax=Gloeocapsopsis dulcis AAB1 = 1H9 TaxID=1433147 RepID=A0A6N8G1M0_9CHRO|nr:hypothetical protein [Gloeocapsopsis dulcis]MUL39308.1 hypothetical protein [Gloeocapsopsis dulcis AAB1 = 1H9]WNN91554.1 hypothetical protein P0S91_10970 [Gloeocapsopsis dulcis]